MTREVRITDDEMVAHLARFECADVVRQRDLRRPITQAGQTIPPRPAYGSRADQV